VKKSRTTPYYRKSKFRKACEEQDRIMAEIFRTLRKNAQDAIDAQEQREENLKIIYTVMEEPSFMEPLFMEELPEELPELHLPEALPASLPETLPELHLPETLPESLPESLPELLPEWFLESPLAPRIGFLDEYP